MPALAIPAASGGSAEHPDVVDDATGEQGLPAVLNVLSGWVGNETAPAFSVFMKIQDLAAPHNSTRVYHYHFHFQVVMANGSDALFHAMVHHPASGAWTFMTQRWISSGGTGSWGETMSADGFADASAGIIEVRVLKSTVASPKVDVQRNTWRIDHFYIHADEADVSSGQLLQTDNAPAAGTMGAYDVSVGTPIGAGTTPGAGPLLSLAALVAAAAALGWRARRGGRVP
jgi:hypothetical protein